MSTREEARAFLKRAGLLKIRRTIEGAEREQVFTMLRLIGPGRNSDNQHFWTESWTVGGIEYNHYTGQDIDMLEEVKEDDI